MNKDVTITGAALLSSMVISFASATYLLNNKLLYAVALIGLYFFGGLWGPLGKIGAKAHALWIGISIGFFAAILFFLPSAFAV